MAKQTAKTRNPDGRRNGKAWGKDHNATAKVLSPEAQERKAHKDAERARKRVSHGGRSMTMPSFDWQWAGEVMRGLHTHTRRFRTVEACMAQERNKS
jgi:hypothetical protein